MNQPPVDGRALHNSGALNLTGSVRSIKEATVMKSQGAGVEQNETPPARTDGRRPGRTKPDDQVGRRAPVQQSGREDLNLRPPGPEPGALTGLRYAPKKPAVRRTGLQ